MPKTVFSGRVPKYRLHKATGQAVVTIAGRDCYLGRHGSAESRERYSRLVAESIQCGGVAPAPKCETTVAEVMAAFLAHARQYYRKNGKPTREYEMIAEVCRLIKPLYARSPAVDFGPLALKAVRQRMIDADYARRYINKQTERIRRMFKWAAAEELIPASVPQALAMVTGLRQGRSAARETAPVLPVSDAALEATLPFLPEVVFDLVSFLRFTGARPDEACAIRPCDVDRSGDVWLYRPASHKTEHHGRERVVPIGARAQGVLLKYLARDPEAYCFRPSDSEAKRRAARAAARVVPLSCGNRPGSNRKVRPKRSAGDRYDANSLRRAIHRACDKADVPRWSPNQLRHAAATAIRQRFGLEAAQVVLGHAAADVTQIYAERDVAKAVEVARMIG